MKWPLLLFVLPPNSEDADNPSYFNDDIFDNSFDSDEDAGSDLSWNPEWGYEPDAWEALLPPLSHALQSLQDIAAEKLANGFLNGQGKIFDQSIAAETVLSPPSTELIETTNEPDDISAHVRVAQGSKNQLNGLKRPISDVQGDEQPPAKRLNIESKAKQHQLLACPYAKHDPVGHRKCFRYTLKSIARLK